MTTGTRNAAILRLACAFYRWKVSGQRNGSFEERKRMSLGDALGVCGMFAFWASLHYGDRVLAILEEWVRSKSNRRDGNQLTFPDVCPVTLRHTALVAQGPGVAEG